MTVRLAYQRPFAWNELTSFLAARAIPNIETVQHGVYRRTIVLDQCVGCIEARNHAEDDTIVVSLDATLQLVAREIGARLRKLFDVDSEPALVDDTLSQCSVLAPLVRRRPGLRVPGAFDGFELAWRAVLGQQISVRGATTIAGRFAQTFGTPIDTNVQGLRQLTPTADRVAATTPEEIAKIGIPHKRAVSLHALANLAVTEPSVLEPGASIQESMDRLLALPGFGPWTVQYFAMRALHVSEVMPVGDLGLKKALGNCSEKTVADHAKRWHPWQAYAAMHLWTSLGKGRRDGGT